MKKEQLRLDKEFIAVGDTATEVGGGMAPRIALAAAFVVIQLWTAYPVGDEPLSVEGDPGTVGADTSM